MAITFVNSSNAGGTANTDTVTVTKPVGLAAGDFMIAFMTLNLSTVTPPSGWTQYDSDDATSGALFRSIVFWKIATSGDAAATNFTFTASATGSPFVGGIIAYRGVDPNNPISVADIGHATTTQNVATPSLTTTGRNLILHFRTTRRGSATQLTHTASSGTERLDTGNNGASTSYTIAAYDTGTVVNAGSQAGITINASSATSITDSIVRTLAIQEPVDGTSSATLSAVTSQFAGEREIPAGSIGATLGAAVADADGTHHVPASGSIGSTLGAVTSSLAGSVEPIGGFTATIGVFASVVAETRQFGEHIIVVEQDHRAFLVVDDGTDVGLKPIKRSRVTDA